MDVKKWLFSNMFLRNMISDLFGRSAGNRKPGEFTPYFQYRIGLYQSDYYLDFPKEPYTKQYKNEIFNKLYEFDDSDIADYLDFHYSAYPAKPGFLKFLQYELYGRINRKITAGMRQKLQVAQKWVEEKQKELQSQQQATFKQEIEKEVREALPAGTQANPENIEHIVNALTQKLADHFDQLMAATGEKMQSLTDSFVTANIELNNQNHLDNVIKLFKLLKDVRAPKQPGRATEQLFKRFSDTDIAAILRLHFEALKTKQPNTIQVNIKKADERIPDKSPKVIKLEEALADFFYS
jgi:hypothetical protein